MLVACDNRGCDYDYDDLFSLFSIHLQMSCRVSAGSLNLTPTTPIPTCTHARDVSSHASRRDFIDEAYTSQVFANTALFITSLSMSRVIFRDATAFAPIFHCHRLPLSARLRLCSQSKLSHEVRVHTLLRRYGARVVPLT